MAYPRELRTIRPARYRDRADAGKILAERLRFLAHAAAPIVLGVPPGGVAVAFEVAERLGAPLEALPVRKLPVPGHEERSMGAIAAGGARVLNPAVLEDVPNPEQAVEEVVRRERAELERELARYRGERPLPTLRGRTVVLVDDGIATGASLRAAAQAALAQQPARVVAAAPVAPLDTLALLRRELPEVVVPLVPAPFFGGVAFWYDRFPDLSEDEVCELLRRARGRVGAEG